MVTARRNPAPSAPTENPPPMFDWSTSMFENMLRVQQFQLDALTSWQQSVSAMNQELWDEWVAHWAGGVPIEG
jgi:hypothetical protein